MKYRVREENGKFYPQIKRNWYSKWESINRMASITGTHFYKNTRESAELEIKLSQEVFENIKRNNKILKTLLKRS